MRRREIALVWAALVLVLALALPARAGDAARLEAYGWSPDGCFFTYGNSGIQDGSGFAYADRTILDARTSTRVFSVARRENESTPNPGNVAAMRAQVDAASREARRRRGLTDPVAGTVLFRRPAITPGHAGTWGQPGRGERLVFLWKGQRYVLRLTQDVRGDPARDPYAVRGRLTVTLDGPHGARVLRRDAAWTTRYRNQIQAVTIGPGGKTMAAIIAAWPVGFEGPDVRYVGVAGRL